MKASLQAHTCPVTLYKPCVFQLVVLLPQKTLPPESSPMSLGKLPAIFAVSGSLKVTAPPVSAHKNPADTPLLFWAHRGPKTVNLAPVDKVIPPPYALSVFDRKEVLPPVIVAVAPLDRKSAPSGPLLSSKVTCGRCRMCCKGRQSVNLCYTGSCEAWNSIASRSLIHAIWSAMQRGTIALSEIRHCEICWLSNFKCIAINMCDTSCMRYLSACQTHEADCHASPTLTVSMTMLAVAPPLMAAPPPSPPPLLYKN